MLAKLFVVAVVLLVHDVRQPDGTYAYNPGKGTQSPMGEWCCGEGDCFEVPKDQISMDGTGYWIGSWEHIPFKEAQPSMDGAFWRCKRPDGSRRCFFAPSPST